VHAHSGDRPEWLTPALAELAVVIDEFCGRYSNPNTRGQYHTQLWLLFQHTGARHPSDLTERGVLAWCTAPPDPRSHQRATTVANNTVRTRAKVARTFLRWCQRQRLVPLDFTALDTLCGPDSPLRSYAPVYGKQQSPNPARFLTREQAYGSLVAAAQDGTIVGLRDEILLRLGLAGIRLSEMARLTIAALDLDTPRISWMGKRNKPRQATPGAALVDALRRYLAEYEQGLGRALSPDDPLLCARPKRRNAQVIIWGRAIATRDTVYRVVLDRASKAGLGHVATHDLRRTTAAILHRAVDDNGAHFFDLLDIQKVLGHADPATTMRSYLDPMDTGVQDRAAAFLD
jgi:integrase